MAKTLKFPYEHKTISAVSSEISGQGANILEFAVPEEAKNTEPSKIAVNKPYKLNKIYFMNYFMKEMEREHGIDAIHFMKSFIEEFNLWRQEKGLLSVQEPEPEIAKKKIPTSPPKKKSEAKNISKEKPRPLCLAEELGEELPESGKAKYLAKNSKKTKPVQKNIPESNRNERNKLLAQIHIQLNEIYTNPDLAKETYGFSEDVYRSTLSDNYGTRSAAKLNIKQLHEVLAWLCKLTVKSICNPDFKAPQKLKYNNHLQGRLKKIQALLTTKGKQENKFIEWAYANSIAERMTKGKVKNLDKAGDKLLDAIIAALDKDIKRKEQKIMEEEAKNVGKPI